MTTEAASRTSTTDLPLWPAVLRDPRTCEVMTSDGRLAGSSRAWRYNQPVVALVIAGGLGYRTDREERYCAPGTLIVANENDAFEADHVVKSGNRRSVVFFDQAMLDEIAACEGHSNPTFRLSLVEPGKPASLPGAWLEMLGRGDRFDGDLPYLLAARLLAMGRPERTACRLSPQIECRLYEAVRFIDERFAEPCNLDTLSGISQLTRYHFLRSFSRMVGVTPGQYVLHRRLAAAAQRLVSTTESIAQIALDVGFNDLSHFYAHFKQRFGEPPSRWRRRH